MIPCIISDWNAFAVALGWTLIHSLWLAAVVAGLLYFFQGWIKTPQKRYLTLLTGYLVVFVLTGFNFWMLYSPASTPDTAPVEQYSILLESDSPTVVYSEARYENNQHFLLDRVEGILPLIAILWAVGFFLLLSRWVSGLWYLRQLKKWSFSIEKEVWKKVKIKIHQKAAISTTWDLRCSSHITGPVLIGWIKPVILIPIGMVNGLTEEEVEAVLAHEMAHLARRDFPINLIQTFIETLFYFNPGMLLISRWINNEREHCCDDVAVNTIQNSLIYAKTLIKADELSKKGFTPVLAQALKGNKNSLLVRVERILFQKHKKNKIMVQSITASLMLMLSVIFLLAAGLPLANTSKEMQSNNLSYISDLTDEDVISMSGLAESLLSVVEVDSKEQFYPSQTNRPEFPTQQGLGEHSLLNQNVDLSMSGEPDNIGIHPNEEIKKIEMDIEGNQKNTASDNEKEKNLDSDKTFAEGQGEQSSIELIYGSDGNYSDTSKIPLSTERSQTSARISEKVEKIIEEVQRGLEEIDWDEIKEEVTLALSAAQLAIEDLKYKLSKIRVDTLIVVDPATFSKERYLRTTISDLKIQAGKASQMDFSVVATFDQKEQIKDLAFAFRSHLISSGLIESGANQVLLNQSEFKINGEQQSESVHRQLLKKYQDQLEGFYEIWMEERK